MIYSLKEAQKVYLGSQEVSKIFLRGFEIFSSVSADPYSDYVTLLSHFNTDFSDSSTNNIVLSAFGDVQISTNVKKYGTGSLYLPGNSSPGSYVGGNQSEALQFGTQDFTIEMWINAASDHTFSDESRVIYTFCNWPSTLGFLVVYHAGPIGGGPGILVTTGGFNSVLKYFTGSLLNKWTHIALCRNNGNILFFVDGILQTPTYSTPTQLWNVNFNEGLQYIGRPTDQDGVKFHGYIDDLRITKGVARYTSNFTPPQQQLPKPSDPYADNVSLLLHMDGLSGSQTFTDSSSNNFTMSAFGNTQISTSVKKFGNGAAYFDGSGDYLSIADNDAFDFNNTVCSYCGQSEVLPGSTIPFTIEAWFYPTIVDGNSRCIISKHTWGQNGSWVLEFNNTFFTFATKEGWDVLRYPVTIPPNTWHHVAITHTGTTGASAFKLFFNGVQLTNYTDDWDGVFNGEVSNNTGDITIGCSSWNNPSNFFAGYLDDLRITKGVARYTENFTPPTAPFANPLSPFPTTGLLAFYSFQDNILDSVGTISPLITGNLCSFNYTTGLNGTKAIQFNNFGTCALGGGLFCPNDVWNIFQGDTKASFAFWFKYHQNIPLLNPVNAGCGMSFFGSDFGRFGFGVAPNDGVNNRVSCYIANNGSGGARYTDPSSIVVGEWNHIVGTYDNTTRNFKVYRNGNLVHNYTFPSAINAPTQDPNFYKGFGINGSGYITPASTGEYGIPIVIDSLGLWTRVLTDQDISILYNNGLGREP